MPVKTPVVCIVDDDPEVRECLCMMVQEMGLIAVAFPSAEAFLDGFDQLPDGPRCLLLDVRMPGLSGLGLQHILAATGRQMPTIMISGCADIPIAVQAMNAGAMDFLEKPFNEHALAVRVREAIDRSVQQQREMDRKHELVRQLEQLSSRQREVLELLVAGERSKQIARRLGIGEKTVAKHRATVLEKMHVESVVELARLLADFRHTAAPEHTAVA